jgi:hypothetical protein
MVFCAAAIAAVSPMLKAARRRIVFCTAKYV